ncbi:MAG TPA: argininosuccinate lyase [Methanolinea sp.]|nr:argininosuccinate lyase [Methanolinea sp.]
MEQDVVRRGRLTGERSGEMMHFLSSMGADRCIADADILVDIAHVLMLSRQKIIGKEQAGRLLETLLELYENGIPEAAFDDRFEDIHAGIETLLIATIGEDAGGRLHIGRSRNDEVATCIRLRVRDDLVRQLSILIRMREVLLDLAGEHIESVMPGFTHLQHAQPTTLAHHLLAHEAAFARDYQRLSGALSRVDWCPLGSAAFASTSYPVQREFVAGLLGFQGVLENTMDAVSSRDFALEVLSCLSIMMTHASRVCEELVVWSSGFARFVELDDAFCSTSSIMPQKKNPDTAEVMRAKAASVLGSATASFAIVKGLPLSYNRDLQELNPHLWRGIRDAKHSTRLLIDMLSSATFNTAVMAGEAGKGFSTATDVADMLVQSHGFAFRTAHTLVGKAIQKGALDIPALDQAAEEMGIQPPSKMGIRDEEIAAALDVRACIERRRAPGSPSPFAVRISLSSRRTALHEDLRSLEERMAHYAESVRRLISDAKKEVGK